MDYEDQKEQDLWRIMPHKIDEDRADVLIELAHRAIDRGDGREALALTEEAYRILETKGAAASGSDLSNALLGISHSYRMLSQNEEAFKTLESAIAIARETMAPNLRDNLRTKVTWLIHLGNPKEAITVLQEIIQMHDFENRYDAIGKDLHAIGYCYLSLGEWIECINYTRQAREAFVNSGQYESASNCDAQMALAYVELGDSEIARALAIRSLAIAEIRGRDEFRSLNLLTLGIASAQLENFEEAEQYLLDAKEIAAGGDDWSIIEKIQRELYNIYIVTGKQHLANKIEQNLTALKETMTNS